MWIDDPNGVRDKTVLLSEVMPVYRRTLQLAVEAERRRVCLELKQLLDATEQDLFTLPQLDVLIDMAGNPK